MMRIEKILNNILLFASIGLVISSVINLALFFLGCYLMGW